MKPISNSSSLLDGQNDLDVPAFLRNKMK
jgi:hypothetical protein